ncbi:MAG: bilirubin oxidase [Deltaproteobacteria bacterium]|nr:MAG: bilirubin oxidase [Deltaproteobacteria bacterium]
MCRSKSSMLTLLAALAVLTAGLAAGAQAAALPGGSLDPTAIPKYAEPLTIPPVMPKSTAPKRGIDYYEIAVRQFQQQVLPTGFPTTKVWGYGSRTAPTNTFSYPAYTIESKVNRPVRVKWINELKDLDPNSPTFGNFLPHILPVDQTLHWANPTRVGNDGAIDSRPDFTGLGTPGPYTGPVPMVAHLHGAHVGEESDGFPQAWWLPAANNLGDATTKGTNYGQFDPANTEPGTAVFQYPNTQRAATLWFHDHSVGMTRVNVYAGPAGFYLLRGGISDLPPGVVPEGKYEVPLVVQDRAFNLDGSLFFPDSRAFFDGFEGPFIPDSDMAPIHNPEFFGNTMVVNGKTWPVMEVERHRYRFRFLNASNSRFLILKLVAADPGQNDASVQPALPIWQIGADGGFLPGVVRPRYQGVNQLLIGLAERADVIIDFRGFPVGTELYLANLGPDEPFGGGVPGVDFPISDPGTTGQVMKFKVVAATAPDTTTPPGRLALPRFDNCGPVNRVRRVSLNEFDSDILPGVGPRTALLGILDSGLNPVGKMFAEPVTEKPKLNTTELWEIYNFTADAHPIHLHQVQFEVVNRQPLVTDEEGVAVAPATLAGPRINRESWERGTKDTVIAYPGMVTRLKARFDIPGLYVWHCHILDHEDNEMMRPIQVVP